MEEFTHMRLVDPAEDIELLAELVALEGASIGKNSHWRSPPLPHHVMELIKKKRKLRKVWQFTRDPKQKTALNRLTDKIKKEVAKVNASYWEIPPSIFAYFLDSPGQDVSPDEDHGSHTTT